MRYRLSAAKAKSLGVGKHHDGDGLYLVKKRPPKGNWILRFTLYGRRRSMGLGPYPLVGLGEARRSADDARLLVRQERDPIAERRMRQVANTHLLNDVAEAAFEARKAELKDDGKAGRWMSPLALHILPQLGKTPVVKLNQNDIAYVLKLIWHTKSVTAQKALNRLNIVIKHAAAMGLDVDMQVTKKASALLGKPRHKTKKIPAMDWRNVPAYYAGLNDGSVTHLCLRFLILTGARSYAIRFARYDQIQGKVWTIPAENMKSTRDKAEPFRVPLSREALRAVAEVTHFERDGFLFPSLRKGVISNATMARFMERQGIEARPHGFRSSLRTWLAESTDAPFEIAEAVLAHQPMTEVQRAYQRSDYLERRAILMQRWADHVTSSKKLSLEPSL